GIAEPIQRRGVARAIEPGIPTASGIRIPGVPPVSPQLQVALIVRLLQPDAVIPRIGVVDRILVDLPDQQPLCRQGGVKADAFPVLDQEILAPDPAAAPE